MSQNLQGKVAIITGAGRGIGREEALALAAAGAKVVVNDLGGNWDGLGADASPADEVIAEIRAAGGEAVANYGDVAQMVTGQQLVTQALDSFGRLDILINNAGILRPKLFSQLAEADWDRLIAVHLKGHFTVTLAAVQVFAKQASGRIVNTSSEAGLGMPLFSVYGAAKEGITGLTRTLAQELAQYNVTVNQIRPRSADTRMTAPTKEAGEALGFSVDATLPGAADQGLFSNPEQFGSDRVAAFVVFLCSDAAGAITGGDFSVGGGQVSLLSQVRPIATLDWTSAGSPEKLIGLVAKNQIHWSVPLGSE